MSLKATRIRSTSQLAGHAVLALAPPLSAPKAAVRDTHRRMPDESTTPDLVELQKRLTAAPNRGDVDAIVAFYAPDAVYDMSPVGMGVFEGQGRRVASLRTGGPPTRRASSRPRRLSTLATEL